MRDLKVIGVEDGALVAATEEGERFRLVVDEVLQSHVRRSRQEPYNGPKLSPRDVQAHIRSGMSAEEVARLTGVPVEYVQRFEGPVLAEREHIVGAALSVAVIAPVDPQSAEDESTFGAAIRARLAALEASNETWTSWKEDSGSWIVKLSFTSADVDHDARWSFEPKKHALSPLNAEAITLSKQGEMPNALIPRLRAVEKEAPRPDETRFDSGAFTFAEDEHDKGPKLELTAVSRPQSSSKATAAAINRGADDTVKPSQSHQTADLLEALRKRRGEREGAHLPGDADEHTASRPHPVDVPLADFEELSSTESPSATPRNPPESSQAQGAPPQPRGSRRGRASMPSWDEIVFGARTDDD
ncbi:septation protein SepH [Okibacterium endophyticum]